MWEREARLPPNSARVPGVGLSVRIVFFFFFLWEREARLPPNSARVPGVGLCAYRLIFLKLKSPLGHSKAEWWKLPEDWATETPNFFLRTAFSQLKGCENPEIFLRTVFSQLKGCDKPNFVSSDQHRLSYRGSRKKVASTTRLAT